MKASEVTSAVGGGRVLFTFLAQWHATAELLRWMSMDALRPMFFVLLAAGMFGCANHRLDLTSGVPSTCEVHHRPMLKTTVPMEYGLIRFNEYGLARQAASTNLFPHAEECVLGGCVVGREKKAVVYVCPDCQRALRSWENARENDKPKS